MPNLFTDPEALDLWDLNQVTVSANSVASPLGGSTAERFTITATPGDRVSRLVNVSANTTYTMSFYAQRGTTTALQLHVLDATFTGADPVPIQSYFAETSVSGWTRIIRTFTTGATVTQIRCYLIENCAVTGTVDLWGAYLNLGSTAEPYPGFAENVVLRSYAEKGINRKKARPGGLFERNPVALFDRALPYGGAGGTPANTGNATSSQAQTSVAAGSVVVPGISGTANQSQAQTVALTGTATPPAISGPGAQSQAQTTISTGTIAAPGVTGTASPSQAQTSVSTGAVSLPAISGSCASSQVQTTVAAGSFALSGVSGSATSAQAQTSVAIGITSLPSISGNTSSSQAQTSLAAGTFALAGVSGGASSSQAQASALVGSFTLPAISGVVATSQAQTSILAGTFTPAAIAGVTVSAQAQSTAATGFSAAGGIFGSAASFQAQATNGLGSVVGDAASVGGIADWVSSEIRRRAVQAAVQRKAKKTFIEAQLPEIAEEAKQFERQAKDEAKKRAVIERESMHRAQYESALVDVLRNQFLNDRVKAEARLMADIEQRHLQALYDQFVDETERMAVEIIVKAQRAAWMIALAD